MDELWDGHTRSVIVFLRSNKIFQLQGSRFDKSTNQCNLTYNCVHDMTHYTYIYDMICIT